MLRSLDLFTGIGGMSLALHGLARPLLYCDIAPESRAVIAARVGAGDLPAAPIVPDVRLIDGPSVAGSERDVIIVAGFPCVGFSPMGKQMAFANDESGLFREVVRICDSFVRPPPIIFLENVPNVLRIGMPEIIDQLSVRRGYELRWCCMSAESMGAPHVRMRWFCLAVQPGFEFTWAQPAPYRPYPWTISAFHGVPRTTDPADHEARARCGLLGNSVVPDAVRCAFLHLIRGNAVGNLDVAAGTSLVPAADAQKTRDGRPPKGAVPHAGFVRAGSRTVVQAAAPAPFKEPEVPGPTLDPAAFASPKPPSPLLRTPLIRRVMRMDRWSTPRHALTGACNFLTERSLRDLPTQVRFEVDTEGREGALSPEFVEFLMGFPRGWTELT